MSPSRRVALVMVAAALAVAAGALLFHRRHRRPPPVRRVILVSIDTLRADRLGCYGGSVPTPHIDRLAGEGVLYENAATSTPLTLPAHASLFTGRSPLRHGILDNFGYRLGEKERTLAELLKEAGFETGGFVGSFVLDSRWGVAQGFDVYRDDFEAFSEGVDTLWATQRPGDQVLSQAVEWIRARGEEPFFAFIHFYDPHTPYGPPEPYRSRFGPTESGFYDGEVAFVDGLVGELVEALVEEGLYDDALVVLLADHGESLGDHGESTHGYFIYDETVRVPLIIKAPGARAGGRVRAQVRTIDVLPTVLERLGMDTSAEVEGVSLVRTLEAPTQDPKLLAYIESHYPRIHFGWAPLRALRTEGLKFIQAPEKELYDLRQDPGERRNLIADRKGVAEQLDSTLQGLVRERSTPDVWPAVVDAEAERRLAALGYVTGSSAMAPGDDASLPDPKAKIDVFNRIAEARVAGQLGEMERAAELLTSVLRQDPEVMLAYMVLGNLRLQQRRFVEAAEVFRSALERDERSVDGAYGMALAYKGLGKIEEAALGFERILETLDPGHSRSLYQLADLRLAQGRAAEAETLLRDIPTGAADTSLRVLLADTLLAQSRREEALAVLSDAAREDPKAFLVHLNLGNLQLDGGDLRAAVASYERALSLAPRSAAVWNARGNAFAREGDDHGALGAFQKAVELDPSFAAAQNNLGIALARNGRAAGAERAFRKAIEHNPDYAEAYNNLGFLYLQAGAVREAVPLFRRALSLKPDYLQARTNLEAALRMAPRGSGKS